jgi:hypothetical protein
MQKNMQNMHMPHFWYKKIVKYEKNANYVYLTPCLPAAGRSGLKFLNMHNITKYVEYAEYGLPLYLHSAAVEICKTLLVLHNMLYHAAGQS